jgi:uncharacterized protein YkwD
MQLLWFKCFHVQIIKVRFSPKNNFKAKKKITKTNSLKRLTISLLLISTISTLYSQTPLESKVFQKINDYRVENGANRLKWDDATYKSTQIHTEYMIKDGKLSHTQNSETPKFTNRLMLFQDKTFIIGNENVSAVSINGIEDDIDKIADKILYSWKISKSHNTAMLVKGLTIAAISCGDGIIIEGNYTFKMKYSTFVIWNNQF